MNFIRTQPIYKECIWGGTALKKNFKRKIPIKNLVGESWEIADRPKDNTLIVGGMFDGKTLNEAIQENPSFIMGRHWKKQWRFPLMVKWLDAAKKLSLQVHPTEKSAKTFGGEVKTENWYVARCDSDAKLTVGLKKGATKREFCAALADHTVARFLHEISIKEGDVILIPSGRLHSIGAGSLILEIQQNSDTTYRVYDWGRLGLDGKPRALHIEEFLESANFKDFEPKAISSVGKNMSICNCPSFTSRTQYLNKGEVLEFAAGEQPRILSVVKGALKSSCGEKLKMSENVILPYGCAQEFKATAEQTLVIITENFAKPVPAAATKLKS